MFDLSWSNHSEGRSVVRSFASSCLRSEIPIRRGLTGRVPEMVLSVFCRVFSPGAPGSPWGRLPPRGVRVQTAFSEKIRRENDG